MSLKLVGPDESRHMQSLSSDDHSEEELGTGRSATRSEGPRPPAGDTLLPDGQPLSAWGSYGAYHETGTLTYVSGHRGVARLLEGGVEYHEPDLVRRWLV